jgi:hypothetical protein
MMLQATRDIRKVALWLGYADVRTTEIYLRLDPSEIPSATCLTSGAVQGARRANRLSFQPGDI